MKEKAYCIGCGEPVSNIGWGSQCKRCGMLDTRYYRCLSTGENGCKGNTLFRGLDLKKIERCPKCKETGQFAEAEI